MEANKVGGTFSMSNFEVTQRLLSVASRYDVRTEGSETIVMTIKGTLMSATPNFSLLEGTEGKELGSLKGNFAKTKFQILDAAGKEQASIEFPSIALKKTLALQVGDKTFTADAGVFKDVFQCKSADSAVVLEVAKKSGLTAVRDKFVVKVTDSITQEIGLLAAVAIHSRFFEMV
jgi:hypothetical protein